MEESLFKSSAHPRAPERRIKTWMLWLAFWAGYCLLPLATRGFNLYRVDCIPYYGAAVFLTFFAWIGYFGLGSAVAVWQLAPQKSNRVGLFAALMIGFALLYLAAFLPPLLVRCQVFAA